MSTNSRPAALAAPVAASPSQAPAAGGVLLTGATGFLGQAVLEALAAQRPGTRFFVLARRASVRACRARFSPLGKERLHVLTGDLGCDELALGARDREAILGEVTEVWHLAAATTFDDRREAEITNVNVGGTRRLLALLAKARHLERFYFTSTAYIVGADRAVAPEDELPPVRRFNNAYEASKWQAEKLVRESGLPFTIFRPSILLDRSDGRCEGDGRMMYGYLLGIYGALARHFRAQGVDLRQHLAGDGSLECDFRLVGHEPVAKNFVCLDEVVAAMLAIAAAPAAECGRTFNLTNPAAVLGWQVGEALEAALRVKGLRYVGDTVPDPTPAEALARRHTRQFEPYTTRSDPVWPTANTDAALDGRHQRRSMTPALFTFLLRAFVEQCVIASKEKQRPAAKSSLS